MCKGLLLLGSNWGQSVFCLSSYIILSWTCRCFLSLVECGASLCKNRNRKESTRRKEQCQRAHEERRHLQEKAERVKRLLAENLSFSSVLSLLHTKGIPCFAAPRVCFISVQSVWLASGRVSTLLVPDQLQRSPASKSNCAGHCPCPRGAALRSGCAGETAACCPASSLGKA